MPTPEYCTLDGDPGTSVQPYVPTVDDMGGAAFVDDDVDPPEPEENVMSRDINQMQELLVRACRMIPKASFHVRYVSATSTITLIGFKSSNNLFLSSQVTLTAGTNAFTIRWPLRLLPTATTGSVVTPSAIESFNSGDDQVPVMVRATQYVDANYAYVVITLLSASTNAISYSRFTGRIDVDGEGTFST
jgi:hypothetical protein